jgi:hypothetical protein
MNKKIVLEFEEREKTLGRKQLLVKRVKILRDTQGTLEEKHNHCILGKNPKRRDLNMQLYRR